MLRPPSPAFPASALPLLCLALSFLLGGCGAEPPAVRDAAPSPPPAAPTAPPLFTDEAAATGLDFVHFNGMTGGYYYAEMMGSGAALFDYDGDGDLDAYLVQGNLLGAGKSAADAVFPPDRPLPLTDRLYRNDLEVAADGRRTLRFTDITAAAGLGVTGYGMGVAAGDVDNDGRVDLYLTALGPNRLLRNDGDGTFRDRTAASGTGEARWSVSAAFFDYDRDGWLDLYVGNYLDYAVATDKECTDELGGRNYCGPLAFTPLPDTLYHNRGDGTFEDVSHRAGIDTEHGGALGVGVGDFDGDGWLDVYVANDGLPNQLWQNRGDGTFENVALLGGCAVNAVGHAEASMGVAVGDVDGDGDEDVFLSHLTQETNTLYLNDGRAVFEDRSAASGLGNPSLDATGFGAAWLDVDLDGRLDAVVVNGAVKVIQRLALAGDPFPLRQGDQLFLGRGDGTFEDATRRAGPVFAVAAVGRGLAVGDVDNDGDPDLLVSDNSGAARLLLDRAERRGGWVGLRLVGGNGDRDQLGAWVGVVRAAGPTLWRRVATAGSYASASDPRLLFGLGEEAEVREVRVRWPDGRWERFGPVPLGRYTTLRQGSGSPSGGSGG